MCVGGGGGEGREREDNFAPSVAAPGSGWILCLSLSLFVSGEAAIN